MSTNIIKSLRIKQCEQELLEIWILENKDNMKTEKTPTEILHNFIYLGLCKAKIDGDGILRIS
jgi:hypothetical protein